MNTSEFIQSIDSDNIPFIIANFFEEIMVLYNLIGNMNNLNISSNSDASLATFILTMDSHEQALELYENLNNTDFSVYEHRFYVSMQLNDKQIITTITQATL